jgi:C-3',4' desaturase CrtD
LERDGGKLLMRHRVLDIQTDRSKATGVTVQSVDRTWLETADYVVANVTVQNLVELVQGDLAQKSFWWSNYRSNTTKLPTPSAAFVIYLGVDQAAIPENCPPHLQFLYDEQQIIGENNSLFVSVSKPGDGRAPAGQATIIASTFTDPDRWYASGVDVAALKAEYTKTAIDRLSSYFQLTPALIKVCEAGTPQTFERYTARLQGFVGGIGQRVPNFGPFGIANRTPINGLWLVGDSTHPGEGTAGVSYSALTVVRQIQQQL